jgi:hypothetical protein
MDQERINKIEFSSAEKTCFFSMVTSFEGEKHARFLYKSLRAFGGPLKDCPILIFQADPGREEHIDFDMEDVHVIPLEIGEELRNYWFGGKVYVCSVAEEMVGGDVRSLVWLTTQCLVINPPILFDLGSAFDAALRPVHISNIGSPIDEPLDKFWSEVYRLIGIEEFQHTVTSFVDNRELRPYFNSHIFSINPSKGILRTSLEYFKKMIMDRDFQSDSCADLEHQIFLHQAILSTLVMRDLEWERICILPDGYSYPLHLHKEVPSTLRPMSINSQVCPVYEDTYQHPETLNGLEILEPINSWIIENMPLGSGI